MINACIQGRKGGDFRDFPTLLEDSGQWEYQKTNKKLKGCSSPIPKKEKPRNLFRGLIIQLARHAVATAISVYFSISILRVEQ